MSGTARRAGVALAMAGLAAAASTGVAVGHSAATSPLTLGDLTTYGYGNARLGSDPVDPAIHTVAASPRFVLHLDGAVRGQPLLWRSMAYVATEHDTVYAVNLAKGTISWSAHLGTAPTLRQIDAAPGLSPGCGNIDPLGITGTPVLDPASQTLYVAQETLVGVASWRGVQHQLVAVSSATGAVRFRRRIDPPNTPVVAALQQRPALTLANGRVYVAYGGLDGDCGSYHGSVVSMAASGVGNLASYQVPSPNEGAIWGSGGPLVLANGNLVVATGNGASTTSFDGGDALVELTPALKVAAVWAPADWRQRNSDDADLGSASAITVAGTSLVFSAGKTVGGQSLGYVVDPAHLGGPGGPAGVGTVCASGGAGVFGSDASAQVAIGGHLIPLVFAACNDGTVALAVNAATKSFTRLWVASGASPACPPVFAGGLVWALDLYAPALDAFRPTTGALVFSRPTGAISHFAVPAVGDHLVVVPTTQGIEAFSVA